MTAHAHLIPEVAAALELPLLERIEFCQMDRWVGYTRAQQILKQLDDVFAYPKSLRMPNILLVGRSDNGKSSIVQHFVHRHPMIMREDGSPGPCVAWVSMPATPSESSFWSEVLWSLNIRHGERDPPEKKRRQAFDAMEYASVRVLAIDEFNHLTNAGKDAAKLLAAIKNISTALRIPIIASGTQAAINALNSDPQMKSRFEPAVLDRWKLDREYLRFLASYETFLPLAQPSNLAGREIAPTIYGMAGDTIGGTVKLLKSAASHALRTGHERIDAGVLAAMNYVRSGDWDEAARRA
ncbi:UNVERIFIED_ORG: hypothetical protein J2W38_006746 [Variovorax paradoxus]|nr:hypothetical protein [Variovorax paradoxus]